MSDKKQPSPQPTPKPTPPVRHDNSEHRGYNLPPTSANPPMPPVKPPAKSKD